MTELGWSQALLDPLPEPQWRWLVIDGGRADDTQRMQERSHYRWHQENRARECERQEVPQNSSKSGLWERLRTGL